MNPKEIEPSFSVDYLFARSLLVRLIALLGAVETAALSYLFFHPEQFGFLFQWIIPLILLLFAASEIALPQKKWLVTIPSFLMPLLLTLLLWNELGIREMILALAVIGSAYLLTNRTAAFFQRMIRQIADYRRRSDGIENDLKDILAENDFYIRRLPEMKNQIRTQQRLSAFSREMGKLLDAEIIRKDLIENLEDLFPDAEVSLRSPSLGQDPLDHWVTEKRASLLIKDIAGDSRFNPFTSIGIKSAIVVPLVVERNLIGLVRVDSDAPNRFIETDLQQLELYTHIASLALENAHLFDKVNGMATRDGLTGLATHRIFQEKLSAEILRSARYRTQFSLIMLDIDHFKSVNDQYGHLVGDQVLREISQILLQSCRTVDIAARYGGEEFAMILPEIGLTEASGWAENLRTLIQNHPVQTSQSSLNITASIGCSSFPADAQSSNQLIRTADERLYKAKSLGRNRVICD